MNQMPLRSVGDIVLVDPVLYSADHVSGSVGPINSYFITSQAEDEATPWSWSYTAGEWQVGWIPLSTKLGLDGCYMDIICTEGMLKGSAIVDCERRTGIVHTIEPAVYSEYNTRNWFEVGIFVNDTLVARTGKVFARRFTFDLPFSSYVGNGSNVIDVRWRAIDTTPDHGLVGYVPPPFNCYSSTLWVRNQKR